MARLEDLIPNAAVKGLRPGRVFTVVSVEWSHAEVVRVKLTYKDPHGVVRTTYLFRSDETHLEVAAQGQPWSFDGDSALFSLLSKVTLFLPASLTEEESGIIREAREKTGRRQFRKKQCFRNSQLLTQSDDRVGYAEGVAIGHQSVVHHAWNVICGKVVDLTWKYEGTFPPDIHYHGLVFSHPELRTHLLSLGCGMVETPMLDYEIVNELTHRLEGEVFP